MLGERLKNPKPKVIEGVTFHAVRTGVSRFAMLDESGQRRVWPNHGGLTYSASVGGKTIGSRYRSESAAMKAAALFS